ncbi:hypothetical protein [Pseudomonas sp. B33.4]|uniref:hypothetical protein n=1 Tax=Pseudomonas sp. B33.4 TaxID=3104265 RepID=UPI002ADEAACE|nr:hypothetical protein [Pseudomonas sp. B33.4]
MNMQTLDDAGKLDLDFGTAGVVSIINFNYPSINITGVQIGPDKKIYVAGKVEGGSDPESAFVLGRFDADGTLDLDYGVSGFAHWVYDDFDIDGVESFAFQADRKVVVNCTVRNSVGQQVAAFSRVGVDGWIDLDFGTNGHTVLNIELSPPAKRTAPINLAAKQENRSLHANGPGGSRNGVEILKDGKILASFSYFFNFSQVHGLLIRLNKNGSLDLSFNQIGYITVIHPDYLLDVTVLSNLMVQADGKYLGCGWVFGPSTASAAMFVRYDDTGKPDPTFGANGFVTVTGEGIEHFVNFMVQQPNQRILGGGSTQGDEALLISIEPDGSPNIQFNGGKPLYTDLNPGALTLWFDAAIQKDGKIVVAGGLGEPNNQVDIVVARFIDAQFDPAFNDGKGWVATHLQDGTEYANGLTLQEDGKILICAKLPNGQSALLRYHG